MAYRIISLILISFTVTLAVPVLDDDQGPRAVLLQDRDPEIPKYKFKQNPEALPNVPGLTDITGTATQGNNVYVYRIGNIVPREADTSFGLKMSGKDEVPKLRVQLASTAARLENGKRVENSAAAKLFDLAVDYKIKQQNCGWLDLVCVNETGTLNLVLSMHVDAEISWDKESKKWTLTKDQISLKTDGLFKFTTDSWWANWIVNPALSFVFNDYVTNGLMKSVKFFLPEKLPLSLPKYIQDSIQGHFEASPDSVFSFNGQMSWFLPMLKATETTELVQFGWLDTQKQDTPAPVEPAPATPHLKENLLAMPVSFKDHNDTNSYDFELGNIVPHIMNVEVDAQLHEGSSGPELTVRLSATCPHSSSAEECTKPAKVHIELDYWVKQLTLPYFSDSGTVILTLDTGMAVTLILDDKKQWKLKALPSAGDFTMDAEMEIKDSRLSALVNPILKFLFNDWIEQKLVDYVAAKVLPKIGTYIPQEYTELLAGPLIKMSTSKFHLRTNVDVSVPKATETVYLQDKLMLDL